jgi:hypothetical protein
MSRVDDRIPIPTNGHQPSSAVVTDSAGAEAVAADPVEGRRGVALNPTTAQLAVGFGIIAWILVLLAGRRRWKR